MARTIKTFTDTGAVPDTVQRTREETIGPVLTEAETDGVLEAGRMPLLSSSLAITAAGSTKDDATALGAEDVYVATTVGVNEGVILPVGVPGQMKWLWNLGANALDVYPAAGGTIDEGAADAPLIVAATEGVMLICVAADTWHGVLGA